MSTVHQLNVMGLTTGTESIPLRLKALGFKTYREYLQSDHWQEFRRRLFRTSAICKRIRKKYGEMRCYFCGGRGPLNVHHMTYKRLGAEHMNDVVVICELCHEAVHKRNRENKRKDLWNASHRVKKKVWKQRQRRQRVVR